MKRYQLKKSQLSGAVTIPPSKSISHRAIICASLAAGKSKVSNVILSQDILATIDCMRRLGAEIEIIEPQTKEEKHVLMIRGNQGFCLERTQEFACGESGSTLRFLIPIVLAFNGQKQPVSFSGKGKLVSRPLDTFYDMFQEQGIDYRTTDGQLPLRTEGTLQAGSFQIPGNISSQFISGLLFALPLLQGDSEIVITTKQESKGYIDLTLEMLEKFSIQIIETENGFKVPGNQNYKAQDLRVDGDFSQAAFWLAAGIIGTQPLTCQEIHYHSSRQGDKAIVDILQDMQGDLKVGQEEIIAVPSSLKGTVIDVAQCPDLVPILAVVAALSEGETRIINAERLRIKESDRLKAITTELNKIGAKITEYPDQLKIEGVESFKGGVQVKGWNDHRIVMALTIASARCQEPLVIEEIEAVKKSYPGFWQDYTLLGGVYYE